MLSMDDSLARRPRTPDPCVVRRWLTLPQGEDSLTDYGFSVSGGNDEVREELVREHSR
jgi:hypothetical protein